MASPADAARQLFCERGGALDEAIGQLLLETITPVTLEVAMDVLATLQRALPPANLPEESRFHCCQVTFSLEITLPPYDSKSVEHLQLSEAEGIATNAAAMQCKQVTVEAADNGGQIAGILDGITVGCGLLLDGIVSIGDGGSFGHFLLLGIGTCLKEQVGVCKILPHLGLTQMARRKWARKMRGPFKDFG